MARPFAEESMVMAGKLAKNCHLPDPLDKYQADFKTWGSRHEP
jgi:hypothetical protein